MNIGKNTTVDWISFTHISDADCDQLNEFYAAFPEIHEFVLNHEHIHYFDRHYEFAYMIDNTLLLKFDSKENQYQAGVNVQIPSHGIRDFAKLLGLDPDDDSSAVGLFKILKSRNCRLSRLDLAYDDFSKTFRPLDFNKWMCNRQIVSRSKKWGFISSARENGTFYGDTFYLGSRSGKYLRIYDKDIESGGEIDSIRYELELHSENARPLLDYICEHGKVNLGDILFRVNPILKVIKTYEDDGDLNVSRRDLLPEWEEFINLKFNEELMPVLPSEGREKNVSKLIEYQEKIFAGAVLLRLAIGSDAFDRLFTEVNFKTIHRKSQLLDVLKVVKDKEIKDDLQDQYLRRYYV